MRTAQYYNGVGWGQSETRESGEENQERIVSKREKKFSVSKDGSLFLRECQKNSLNVWFSH